MDESMENVVEELCRKVAMGEGFVGNERELAMLDAQSADTEFTALEEKIEELEYAKEDYFVLDKSDLDVIVSNAMRKMFFNSTSGAYITPERDDYDQWVDDAVYELTAQMNTKNMGV